MTAIDTRNNKSYDSKFPARIARQIGVGADTVYGWMKTGLKIKQSGNYIIYLDSKTL